MVPPDGKVVWETFLDKGEINGFHPETEEGFLVLSGDERLWLVGLSGRLLMRCADQCLAK